MRSELLVRVRDAFRARSKSLRHREHGWSCERDVQDGYELLRFQFGAPEGLTLVVWEDGELWISARRMESRRVICRTSFYGTVDGEGRALVDAVQRARILAYGAMSGRALEEAYLEAFRDFEPRGVVTVEG